MIWFLHGNLGSPSDWRPVMNDLQSCGHECRALNLWKYLECCPKSMQSMGALLCAEIASHDPAPYLCGYSLGGRLAIQALLHQPNLWKGGILVSTHPGLSTDDERQQRRASDAQWATKCLDLPWSDFLREWDAQPVLGAGTNMGIDTRLRLSPWRRSIARGFIDWSLGCQPDCREGLRATKTPLLWITGEKDNKFTEVGREFLGDHLHLIPGCGHRIPMECPSLLASMIDSFVLPGCHAR
ncbi:MAG: alpha/beta fold hydrolase [Akkermansia sp.]